ncbi:serine/threonine-protein kinase [Chlorogloeopsis sp. ULAP02]|uniref:serine/threonine-protein kinase n=1 Tax=Chlorogloeopsis sp. ULAP02 TaxID=3107926 RepID=UPI0031360738
MIGKLLDHRYQVMQVLATGGFGETYIAQDTKRPGNPICVVKHLKPISAAPSLFDTAKRLFESEAETLEKLGNHDQIPRLLAYFDENQEFYLVQEFIEGHSLSDEMMSSENWTEGEVIDLLTEILNILDFVHSHGVIHRDIKPDNIIRRASDKKLVLLDFGAVKKLRTPSEYATQTSIINAAGYFSATVAIGTPGYMPTEQGQGKPRPNSDIYALGIIAIQALTGVAPVEMQEDPQTGEILWQHLVPISRDLAAILSKMVRYHFKDRYQSAKEALEALQAIDIRSQAGEYRKNLSYGATAFPSRQSQQKTIALAPANNASPASPEIATKPLTSVSKSSNSPDLLQLFVLVFLAGSAAAVAPLVVKNAQNFAANMTEGNDIITAPTCLAVVGAKQANIRSEPSAITSDNIMQKVNKGKKLEVTGRRTKRGWVEVKVDSQRAWIEQVHIKNKDGWVTCLRDKGIAVKTVNDVDLIGSLSTPPAKSVVDSKTSSPETLDPSSLSPQLELEKSQEKTSTKTVEKARKKYESGDLQGAVELVKSIPENASGLKQTTEMLNQWQQDWAKSEAFFNEINKALDSGQWDKVLAYKDKPENLPNIQYWRNKIEPLFKQAAENIAKQKLPQITKPNNNSKDKLSTTESTKQ